MPGYTQQDGARACPSCGAANTEASKYCHECGTTLDADRASAPPDPLLGQTVMGRYRIVAELGEGGMGKVYRAEQKMGNAVRNVAIKTLHPELGRDPQIVARFHRESETVIQLTHPNTIQFYDFGELPDKSLLIVMEYIEGESLAHRLLRGPIPPEKVDRILVQICGSLAEAHAADIVHRDLKPENILLTKRGGQEDFVKVLDFGIAKRSEAEDEKHAKLTKQGMVLGTPPYMSPEQFSGAKLDARSDIYSLGLVTYEMLTGELPFMAKTAWEWATQHLTVPPAPLERYPVAERLPAHKRAAVMRALHKNRDERQATVQEFLREFTGIADPAAAWAAFASGATPPAGDPRVDTGAVVMRAAVGTPDAMPETRESEELARAGIPRAGGWSGGRVAAVIGLFALLGAAGGAAYFFSSGPSTPAPAAGGAEERPAAGDGPRGAEDNASAGIPVSPEVPGAAPAGADAGGATTGGDPSQGDDAKSGRNKPRTAKGAKPGAAAPTTAPPAPPTPGTAPQGSTTPAPNPAPSPGTPAAPPPAATPEWPAPPFEPTPSAPPPPPPDGAKPAPLPPGVTTPTTAAKRPLATAVPIAGARPAAAAPGALPSLEAEAKAALARKDIETAIAKLREMQRIDGGAGGKIQRDLRTAGAQRIAALIQQRKCADAQALYRALKTVNAHGAADRYFGETCGLP